MIAAQYALGVWKYARIVLVGCPMDGAYEQFLTAWQSMRNLFGPRIRSMSGNTAELFGRPDAAFVGA